MWRLQGKSSRLNALNDEERRNGNRRPSFPQSKKSTKRVVRFEVDSDDDKCISSPTGQGHKRRSSFGAFVRRNKGHREGAPGYGATVQQIRQDEQQRENAQNTTSQVQLLQVAREIEQILIDDVHSQNVDQICNAEESSESEGALHPEPLQDPTGSEIILSSTTAKNYTETLARPPRRRSRLLRLGLSSREHARRIPSHSAPDPPGIRLSEEDHRNTSSTAHRRRNHRLTEQDVNAYGLFESAGADEARLRLYERRMQRRHERQEPQEPGTLASLFFSKANILGTDPTIIYAGRSYGMNFLLALPNVLLGIFGVLVLLKLLSLLVAGGIALMVLIALYLLGYAWNQPLRTLRKIQENPVLIWTAMGALGGLLWDFTLRLRPLATFWTESMKNLPRGSCLDDGWSWTLDQCGVLHDIYAFLRTPIDRDRQTLTAFYTAFFDKQDHSVTLLFVTFGIGVGCCIAGVWEVLFGTRDNPSVLYTQCLDRVRLITRNRRQREKEQAQAAWQLEYNRMQTVGGALDRRNSRRPHCSICLEDFPCKKDESSSLFHRHYLLCRHSFHHICIQEWLEINSSCPICRLPLEEGIQTCLAMTPDIT